MSFRVCIGFRVLGLGFRVVGVSKSLGFSFRVLGSSRHEVFRVPFRVAVNRFRVPWSVISCCSCSSV